MTKEEQYNIDVLQSFVDLGKGYLARGEYENLTEDIEATEWALNKIEKLTTERDYYKARYLEFNNGVIEGMKAIEKRDCLHCGSNEASYCENCYQELIAENLKLQRR